MCQCGGAGDRGEIGSPNGELEPEPEAWSQEPEPKPEARSPSGKPRARAGREPERSAGAAARWGALLLGLALEPSLGFALKL